MGCSSCSSCENGGCGSGCEALVPETPLPSVNPVVVFDGDCTFCRRWIRRYWNIKHDGIAWSSFQSGASQFPGISEDRFREAMHVVEPDGTFRRGAAAFFRLQQLVGLRSWPLWMHDRIAPFRMITDTLYRFTARHRGGADRASSLVHGQVAAPSTFQLTRRVFLRCLGLVYLIAFLSAGWQLDGLVGSDGIRPAVERLELIEQSMQRVPFNDLPTLLWLDASDAMLQTLWIGGAIAAVLLMAGLLPMAMLALCWVAYLSITNGGDVFFQYQWDVLLLEIGFISIFFAPFHWRLNAPGIRRPSTAIRLVMLWLLARFMFFSGYVKLQSGDTTWLDLTALEYHYWTQPLPTWTAWYADRFSEWFQKASCFIMFAIELGAPLLLFGPRVLRTIAFVLLVGLQLLILATGNYGFFNLAAIVLCLLLLDDAQWMMLWPKESRWNLRTGLARSDHAGHRWMNAVIVALLLSMSIPLSWAQLTREPAMQQWQDHFNGYHLVNPYGLFRTMTTTRPEILIESSLDGRDWQEVVFPYKPGPLDRRPGFCFPNMPRLDWQMWFDGLHAKARLGNQAASSRMILPDLLDALGQRRGAVLDLLETPPDESARFFRWHLDEYSFTDRLEKTQTGNWWHKERIYTSPILERTLDNQTK